MTRDEFAMHVGFLKPMTTTVDSGAHFADLRNLLEKVSGNELTVSIENNKWLLTKMLELEGNWNDDAKQMHTLLHNQLSHNIKLTT